MIAIGSRLGSGFGSSTESGSEITASLLPAIQYRMAASEVSAAAEQSVEAIPPPKQTTAAKLSVQSHLVSSLPHICTLTAISIFAMTASPR